MKMHSKDWRNAVAWISNVVSLSLPKTGSTTIFKAFEKYGSTHEGFHDVTVDKIIDYKEGLITKKQLNAFLKRRQRLLKTSIDSNTFMHIVAEEIVELYPPSTMYIQVVRHPCAWTASYLAMLHEVGKDVSRSQNQQDLSWTKRYARYQVPTLDLIGLHENINDAKLLGQIVEQMCEYWRQETTRVQQIVHKKQLTTCTLSRIGEMIQLIGDTLQLVPVSTPHANKSRASTEIQMVLAQACNDASRSSNAVKAAICVYNDIQDQEYCAP